MSTESTSNKQIWKVLKGSLSTLNLSPLKARFRNHSLRPRKHHSIVTRSSSSYDLAPRLPLEIIEIIIETTWYLSLSTTSRAAIMKNFLLVNTAWSTIFMRISFTNVHIPSGDYADRFALILTGGSPVYNIFTEGDIQSLILRYRTITMHFQAVDTMSESKSQSAPLGAASLATATNPHSMDASTRTIHWLFIHGYLPHLHHISVHFESVVDFQEGIKFVRSLVLLGLLSSWYPNIPMVTAKSLPEEEERKYGFDSGLRPCIMTIHNVNANQSAIIRSFLVDCVNLAIMASNERRRMNGSFIRVATISSPCKCPWAVRDRDRKGS